MSGAEVERLRSAVNGANKGVVITAKAEWEAAATLLSMVSSALGGASPNIRGQIGQTGGAAAEAFEKVSGHLHDRSKVMLVAAAALGEAAQALDHAEKVRDYIDAHPPADPGPQPTVTPGVDQDHDDINAMRAWSAKKSAADTTAQDHETKARIAADHMDNVYQDSTAAMKKVHGKPDPVPPIKDDGQGGGGSGGGTPPGGGSATPSGGGGKQPTGPTITNPGGPHGDNNVHWDPNNPVHNGGGGGNTVVDPWLPPGSEEGGGSTGPGTIGTVPGGGVSTTSPGGSGLGATGGVVGALGGGVMGGMTGVTGAVRGPSVVPTGGAAGTGGRAIGSTSRTGATGSALGRGTSAATAGSPTGARGGARGGAAGGARSAGGGTRGAGKAGTRGAAGSRGSAGGGQGGRNKKDPKKKGNDFFEEEQDWIDDEGAAPGVID